MKNGLRVFVLFIMLAAVSDEAAAIQIRGVTGCGKWVQEERLHQSPGSTHINFSRTWLVGYLSGLAMGVQNEFFVDPGDNNIDNESIFLWVDNYCRANPLKDVSDAAFELFAERVKARARR